MEQGTDGCIWGLWGCLSFPIAIVLIVIQSLFQNNRRGLHRALKLEQRGLRHERQGESFADFKAAFAGEDVSDSAIASVYQVLSMSAPGGPLPPRRGDSLIHAYGWGS